MTEASNVHDAFARNETRRQAPGGILSYLVIDHDDGEDFSLPVAAFMDRESAVAYVRDAMVNRGADVDAWQTSMMIVPIYVAPNREGRDN